MTHYLKVWMVRPEHWRWATLASGRVEPFDSGYASSEAEARRYAIEAIERDMREKGAPWEEYPPPDQEAKPAVPADDVWTERRD